MKPFVLKQHEKDFARMRELRAITLEQVVGGLTPLKLPTATVTPDGDGGGDGSDEG
jgi:hypothetical protein